MVQMLVADIGATWTRLAFADGKGRLSKMEVSQSRYWPNIEAALRDYLKRNGRADRVVIAAAGPVVNGACRMTNLSWRIDAARLKQKLRAPVLVLNDLEAAGYAVRKPGATAVLKPGTVEKNGTRAVIAAGTGLGMALVTDGKVVPSEGGHATFAPVTAWESAMAQHLHGVLGRWPDTEDLVSGPGINRIYRSLAPAAEEIRSEDITKNALRSPRCKDAVEKFCGLYARAIRDLALYAKATGGVYVTGGIGRAVQGFLARAVPRAFSQKGGIEPLLKRIPVFLLQGQAVILEGAAQAGNAQAAGKDA